MKIPEYTTHEDVMFFDTDCAGVVHNIAYLRMIETCRTHLGVSMGMDFKTMGESSVFPAVIRTEIDYRIPARLGDKLKIFGKLEQLERARFWCSFVISRQSDEKALVSCRQSLALIKIGDDKSARPIRLPQDWSDQWSSISK
ncbi:MAG: acyl-CoA thioesterase [Akkermansiaceae bacterium]